MPKPRREELSWLPGCYYHIFNRGAHHQSIFRQPENYTFVLFRAKQYLGDLELSLIAYCLMPNHYHFLIRQDGDHPAGLIVQRTFNSYSKAFNKKYSHSGTLFERRYQAKSISTDSHLLHLCRYIHANPVKDGLVEKPGDWQYSNYMEWVGMRAGTLVDRAFIRSHFPSSGEYAQFVDDYIQNKWLPDSLQSYLDTL